MKTRKAQIQMGENIAVLVIFFFLLVLGLVFYLRVHTSNTNIKKSEYNDLLAVQISQKVAFMPEIRCSKENIAEPNCFNLEELKIFAGNTVLSLDDRDNYYYGQFRNSKVNISIIYPPSIPCVPASSACVPDSWIIYDKGLKDFGSKISTAVYVSLFDPVTKKYSFGVMNVEVYT